MQQNGLSVIIDKQPANTPDLKDLDFSFFHPLQKHVTEGKNDREVGDIIDAVKIAFKLRNLKALERVWHVLFRVMNAALQYEGNDDFRVDAHGKKQCPNLW